jgi:SAM-dependent methyltransferase
MAPTGANDLTVHDFGDRSRAEPRLQAPNLKVHDRRVTGHEEYLLDNQQVEATFRHALAVGLEAGWRVWEVGAGSPSVPAWFAEQVGAGGHVLATDIDTTWLDSGDTGFEVLRHDAGAEPPPSGSFDLVHARLVLVHVPQRARALVAMVAALKPGGWILIEEADPALQPLACPDETGAEQELANTVKRGFRMLLAERGVDLAYGRTLPRLLRNAGLIAVQSDAYFPMGGPACNELERATVEQVRDALIAAGIATDAEIELHLLNVASGRLDLATSPMVSAWGRKPTA